MNEAKFVLYERSGWRFKLIAGNGEPVAISEPYSSYEAALTGARSVQRVAPSAKIVRQG